MKISQIASLGLLTLAGAIALPAAAATPSGGAQPPKPAANRTAAPRPTNGYFSVELQNATISGAKAPNKPTGNSQATTQSGAPGNGAPGNGRVRKPPGPGAFTDPNPSQRPEDNRIVDSAGTGQATTPPGGTQSNSYSFGATQTGSVVSPRDTASGQATGITSPRDPASGLPTGKTGK